MSASGLVGLATVACFFLPHLLAGSTVQNTSRFPVARELGVRALRETQEVTLSYRFGWSGLEAARGEVKLSFQPDGASELSGQVSTSGAARVLWSLDALVESECTAAGKPSSVRQIEHYRGGRKKLTEIVFKPGQFLTWSWSQPGKQRPEKPKVVKREDVHSMHSALLALQSVDWTVTPEASLLVTPGKAIYRLDAKFMGKKLLKGQFGKSTTYLLEIRLGKLRKDGSIEPHNKVGRIRAWLSNSPERIPLRIEANVFIGYVFAEVTSL